MTPQLANQNQPATGGLEASPPTAGEIGNQRSEPLHRLAEQSPHDPVVWLNLGRALAMNLERSSADEAAAAAALLHALALEPQDGSLLVEIAERLRELSLLDVAADAYRRALTHDPGLSTARIALAELTLDSDPKACLRVLAGGAPSARGAWKYWYLKACCLRQLEQPKEALQAIKRSVTFQDADVPALWLHAQMLGEHELGSACIAAWQRVVRKLPEDPAAQTALGSALVAAGAYKRGVEVLTQVAHEHSKSPGAWLNLALAQKQSGDIEAAVTSVEQALELEPTNSTALDQLGQCLQASGRFQQAADAYRRALQIGPASAAIHQRLASALKFLGQHDRARAELLSAYQLEPNNQELARALSEHPQASPSAPPGAGAFEGRVSEFSVADALEFLKNLRANGRLVLSHEGQKGSISLQDGMVVAASSPHAGSVVHALLAERSVQREQVTGIVHALGTPCSGHDVLTELLARNAVDQSAVDRAARRQIRLALGELISWTDGKFTFHKGATSNPLVQVTLDPGALLLDLMREKDERRAGTERSERPASTESQRK